MEIVNCNTITDERGKLTFLQNFKFPIKRIYYIYGNKDMLNRGGHRHIKTQQIIICVNGSIEIYVNNKGNEETIILNDPAIALFTSAEDWIEMRKFEKNTIIMVLASEEYSKEDYIYEKY